mmetsp:Transcript_2610/g.3810  ORF Transcript_2610/g.3810 Transcript_2610/m.3810 type:complete len:873 (+) Transcript_2610:103-2721(+)
MSIAPQPSGEWKALGDRQYRRHEMYQMAWHGIDLSKYRVACAPFGGPIALTRDDSKIQAVSKDTIKPSIQIFSSKGTQISTFLWDRGRIVALDWTREENLLCVLRDGTVLIFSLHAKSSSEPLIQFSLGAEVKQEGVIDVKLSASGVVVLTANYSFWAVTDFEEPRPQKLADCGLTEEPTSWCIVEPKFQAIATPTDPGVTTGKASSDSIAATSTSAVPTTDSSVHKMVEVFVATRSGTILVVDADGVKDQLLSIGPFTQMAVAPSGKILACFTASGKLLVVSIDFAKVFSKFDTKSKVVPRQLEWCGSDSVLLYWDKILLMVGPGGGYSSYSYDEPLVVISECDGARIISNSRCELLQRVPDVLEEIFKIGATSPPAQLYDAWRHFQERSPKADEYLRSIKAGSHLADAVDACIEAAGHEFSYTTQRSLLQAASFGKSFLDFYYANRFVDMARTLRVLNCVRHPEIGVALTYRQYKMMGVHSLIDRLINRHLHLLAWRICQYLKIKGDKVLVNWACAKVKAASSSGAGRASHPQQLAQLIVDRLSTVPGISYAEIASTAYRFGNPKLATLLLEYEPRAADQVPLLISMQQEELALQKATESGDTDLVYLVLLYMKRTLPRDKFFMIIHNKPVPLALLINYCKKQDLALLKDIYYRAKRPLESGNICALEAYNKPDLEGRLNTLQVALNIYKEGGKATEFQAKACDDQIKLLILQRGLEASLGTKLIDCSLSETLYRIIALGHFKRAAKIKSEFKLPDKRFWWIKIKALAQTQNWEELATFAKEKRSPVGYKPFADVCIEGGVNSEAARYISRIADESDQLNYWIRIQRFNEAADVAMKMKSIEALNFVKSKATKDSQATMYVNKLITQLQS